MKKLWSLIFVLVLALGFSACGKDPDVDPNPEPPTPQGPTELPGSVTDLAYELNGYQEATLTWTNPEEEFELTGFVIKYRAEGGENAEITVDPDDYDAWPIEEFVVEGLEEQVYNFEVLTKNDYGTQKNGTALDGVKVYTLTGIEMPSFEIIEKSIGFVLSASNLSGATNVYYGMDWELKSSDGTVVASGENVIDEELFANIEAKNSTLANVDLPIDGVLDETEKYTVAYTLYAYPALGGTVAEGVYTYESILDMGDEPASVEGTAEGLSAEAEIEPMVIHFWGGDSQHAKYEKVLMTLPLIYHNTPDADGSYPVKAVKYKMYSGSAPDKIEVEKELAWDSEEWLDQTVDNSQVTALCDNYRDQWNGTLTYRLDCETYPAYVKAEAYDEFNRLIAMGQYYTYAYSVQASHEDILDHQPTFALVDNADGATYTFTAKHISAARAYAKKLSWKILNGSDVVAEGATAEVGVAQNPALVDASWIIDATLFEAGNEYSVEYTIDYMPVLNSAEMGEPSPLDYDPATGIFTPALDPENPTGMTHDARILRDYVLDENGKIKYRVNAIENTDDKGYMHVATEGYTYRYLNHWNYNHCDPKVVTITSQDMLDAHSSMKAPAVVAPVLTGTLAEYDMKLVADVDDGTTPVREYFRSYGPDRNWAGYTDWNGLRSVNGIYQGAKVSWNHTGAYKISKVVINGVEVTADGENKWSVDDKFVGSYVVEGLTTSPATIDVKVYSGEELLAEKSIEAAVYTLPEQAVEVPFEIVYNEENLGWRITADKFATKDYGVLAASFNVYEKGSDTPLFTNNVVKNGNGAIANYLAWFSRGFVYTSGGTAFSVTSGDWDDNCTEEFSGGTADTFSGLKANTEYEIRYELKVIPVLHNATYGENTESAFRYDKALSEGDQSNFWGAKTLSGKTVVTSGDAPALALSANATIDAVELSWNPVTDATFEVYVGGEKVGETTETSYTYTVTNTGKYDFEVKVAGKALSATASATVEYLFASYWTAPKFSFDGKRMLVSDLANISAAGGCGYAYGGAITNDNDTSKSTIEIYKDGKLLYTLTNGTGQGTLTAWAGFGRWALNAQENRKDWAWTKADGNKLMEGEGDVPAGTLTNGTYTLKWTIGYVVNKNANWATAASDNAIVATKAEALAALNDNGSTKGILWFGPKDVKPSPNVAYTNDSKNAVKIMTKTGETTLTIGNSEPGTDPEPGVEMKLNAVANGYQGAKLTWDAVEGAEAYYVSYTVAGDEKTVEVKGATEYEISGLTDANKYTFAIEAIDADENVIGEGTAADVAVYTLNGMPEPKVIIENGVSLRAENLLDYMGTVVKLTLKFKDAQGNLVHTASYDKDNTTFNAKTQAAAGRFTKANFWSAPAGAVQTKWVWDGAEADVPTFDAGKYTIEYESECYTFIDGKWGSKSGAQPYDRVFVTEATTLHDKQTLTGTLADKFVVEDSGVVELKLAAAIYDDLKKQSTEGGHRGMFAVNGIYQGAKLTWNAVQDATYDVYYKEAGAADYTLKETVSEAGYTFAEGSLTARKYDFKVEAKKGGDVVATEEVSSDIYTLVDVDKAISFEAIHKGNGDWWINTYGIGGEHYSFVRIEFDIYEKGSSEPVFVTIWKDLESTQNIWAKNRGASSYNEINNSDYDDSIVDPNITTGANEVFRGLKHSTTYEVKVRYAGYAQIYDAEADATDYHKHPEWFYYSSILQSKKNVEEFTVEFTTEAAPLPSNAKIAELTAAAKAAVGTAESASLSSLAGATYKGVVVGSNKNKNLNKQIAVVDNGATAEGSGIIIYENAAASTMEIGKTVIIEVTSSTTVNPFKGMLQIKSVNLTETDDAVVTPTPVELTAAQFNDGDYVGMYVKVTGLSYAGNAGDVWSAASTTSTNFKSGSENVVVRTYVGAAWAGDVISAAQTNGAILGVCGTYNGTNQIFPQTAADVADFKLTTPFIKSVTPASVSFAAEGGTEDLAVELLNATNVTLSGLTAPFSAEWDATNKVVKVSCENTADAAEQTLTIAVEGGNSVDVKVVKAAAGEESVPELVVTFPGNPTAFVSAYNKSFDITLEDVYTFTFNSINNGQSNNNWSAVRFGWKTNATVASIVTKTAIPYAVSSVKINFTQVGTASNVNSAKLIVASDASFANVVEEVSVAPKTGEVVYAVTSPAKNLYYKLEYDMKKDSANGAFRFDKVTYAK